MVAVVAQIASNSLSVSTGKTVPSSANRSSAAGSAGHIAVGLNRLAVEGSGTALAIRVAGGTSLDRLRSDSVTSHAVSPRRCQTIFRPISRIPFGPYRPTEATERASGIGYSP